VLQLLSLLQTHRFWPGGELAERLDVSARTLRREVERLRQLGYPVDATPGIAGGYGSPRAPICPRCSSTTRKPSPSPWGWGRRRAPRLTAHTTVDAEALAVLAQACPDHEQVRFDYRRRDGDETLRLVEPHQLVSAGRRWYLVAWDVRPADWRSLRLDRLQAPVLAGARFRPRPLPADDGAEFVARSIRSMPMPHEVTVVAHGPLDGVRTVMCWSDADIEALGPRTCRVRIRAGSLDWLISAEAMLAIAFDVEAHDPPEVVARLSELSRRLDRAITPRGDEAARR
jgi:predicted DNA-binding transcriptional regulator YafY